MGHLFGCTEVCAGLEGNTLRFAVSPCFQNQIARLRTIAAIGCGDVDSRRGVITSLIELAFHETVVAVAESLAIIFVESGFGFARGSDEHVQRFFWHLAGVLDNGLAEDES